MNILSLFDGMSCGRIALDRAGISVIEYYASEIDKYAIKVSEANYPDIIRLGDVREVEGSDLPQIDLLLAGSPCQGFSFAGKQLAFDDPRSALFFEFVRILRETKPKYFLLENVKMKKEYQKVIIDILEVEPIEINSALLSAQNRRRLYWTNIPNATQPEDRKIILKDILQDLPFDREYYEEKYVSNRPVLHTENKFICLRANAGSRTRGIGICDSSGAWRKLTVNECERLQTVPDNYTDYVSDTQRYKMLGNGWTVDVIAHILKGLL